MSTIIFRKKNSSIINLYPLSQNSNRLCALSSTSSKQDKKSATSTSSLTIFDIDSGKVVANYQSPYKKSPIVCAAIPSNDNQLLIAGCEKGEIVGFSEKSSPPIFELKPRGIVGLSSMSINNTGNLLAVGVRFDQNATTKSDDDRSESDDDEEDENGILFFDIRSPKSPTLLGAYKESHGDTITNIRFDPIDSDRLISSGEDGLINLFDLKQSTEDEALNFTFSCTSTTNRIGFWKSKNDIAAIYGLTDDKKLFAWTIDEGDELFSIDGINIEEIFPALDDEEEHLFCIDCLQPERFSATGHLLVLATSGDGKLSGARIGGKDKRDATILFDGLEIGHEDMIRCLVWKDDREGVIYTGGDDGVVIRADLSKYLGGVQGDEDDDGPKRKKAKKVRG